MAAPPPSSPVFSEKKLNPYEKESKGAYEARKVKGGFYVRVDMPGVPRESVKVVKFSVIRSVAFVGQAPIRWPELDTSERVYGGYVALDRDPTPVAVQVQLNDGSLHLFFPGCNSGSLHFLPLPVSDEPTEGEIGEEDTAEEVSAFADAPKLTCIFHAPYEPTGVKVRTRKIEHINPFLITGVKGVLEYKVTLGQEEEPQIYVRLDIPGCSVNALMEDKNGDIAFGGLGFKASRFDDDRNYMGLLSPKCECCKYRIVKDDTTDGVLRFLVCWSGNDGRSVVHCSLPASLIGRSVRPSNIIGLMCQHLG